MDNKRFIEICKNEVINYNSSITSQITSDDVFVVWSCKTLQNNKALLSTNISDGMYYELTFNGDRKELYFDAYKKCDNKCISLDKEV